MSYIVNHCNVTWTCCNTTFVTQYSLDPLLINSTPARHLTSLWCTVIRHALCKNSMIKKKYNWLVIPKPNVFSGKDRYNIHLIFMNSLCDNSKMADYFNSISFNSKMPSAYHEHCGKPGPKSNEYLPPPESRFFKSRSAPNSPLMGERKSHLPRGSPGLARGLNQLSDKLAGGKSAKSAKVGRSKSFQGKGMCLYCITGIF